MSLKVSLLFQCENADLFESAHFFQSPNFWTNFEKNHEDYAAKKICPAEKGIIFLVKLDKYYEISKIKIKGISGEIRST